jgi:hypothetical protein
MSTFKRLTIASFLAFSLQALLLPNASGQSKGSSTMLADANSSDPPAATPAPPSSTEPSDQGWHVAVSPYLWFAGVNGTAGVLGYETSVHASASDVLSNFNIGIMGAVETRYNRIVIPVDFMWIKLTDNKAIPIGENALSVKAKLNEDMLTPKVGYRVIDKERIKVDGLVGFRYWHLGTTLTLQPVQIANGYYGSANWVDVLGGAKIQALLTPNVVLTILGDAGGGGADSDYQVAGLLGYKLKRVILQGGWRYLHVNYRPSGGFVDDIGMSGLLLGMTIPLK